MRNRTAFVFFLMLLAGVSFLVSFGIANFQSGMVTVVGEVQEPGPHMARGETRIANILAAAGGLTARSNGMAVIMRSGAAGQSRDGDTKSQRTLHVNVRRFLGGSPEENMFIYSGDTIVFPPVEQIVEVPVFVLGAVRKPGVIMFAPGRNLVEAIARAGGATDNAAGVIRIIRNRRGNVRPPGSADTGVHEELPLEDVLTSGRKASLGDGDVVYVPKKKTGKVYVLGQVKSPGACEWRSGSTVFQAVVQAGGFTKHASRESIKIVRLDSGNIKEIQATGNSKLMLGDIVLVSESWF